MSSGRHQSLVQRQAAVRAREQAVARRDKAADVRDRALQARERASMVNAERNATWNAQMREANERLLVAAVSGHAMIEDAERTAAKMSYLAEHDFLTGLPNRALFIDRLSHALMLAQRHGRRGALLYLDLDHFKNINDSLGHLVGDQLLQSTATRLQACVRSSDTVSRLGGDEFVVLLAEIGAPDDALRASRKLLDCMAEPHTIWGRALRVGASIGISVFPDDAVTVETVMKNADTAMYVAKSQGRNNHQLFTTDMNARENEATAEPRPSGLRPPAVAHSHA